MLFFSILFSGELKVTTLRVVLSLPAPRPSDRLVRRNLTPPPSAQRGIRSPGLWVQCSTGWAYRTCQVWWSHGAESSGGPGGQRDSTTNWVRCAPTLATERQRRERERQIERDRERERERERERHRQTHPHRHTEKQRQRQRETDRQTYRLTFRERERLFGSLTVMNLLTGSQPPQSDAWVE